MTEAKVQEFINLKQGNMTMKEYALKLTNLSKYTPFMVAYRKTHMSKFIFGVLDLASKECKMTMLVKEMDISRLMTHDKKIEMEKLRERESKEV